jgi:hypothetical protein
MNEKEKYTLFLLEQYRAKNNFSAKEAYNAFVEKGLFDYIDETYEAIHTEDTGFVVSQLIKNQKL